MKLKASLLATLVTQAFIAAQCVAMEENTDCASASMHFQLRPTIKDLIIEGIPLKCHTQRYFQLDKTQETPLIDQFTSQSIEIYQMRKLYMIDQKEFLEALQHRIDTEKDVDLQNLHPWFNDLSSLEITRILFGNIKSYTSSIANVDKHIKFLDQVDNTLDSLFVTTVTQKMLTLESRDSRRASSILLPSTKPAEILKLRDYDKFVALEAVTNFRILDEMILALFPHVSQNAFTQANEITEEKSAIKQDLSFMQFLDGQVDVPLDPDTTMDRRTLPGKIKEILLPQSYTYKKVVMPVIPTEHQILYNKLLTSLADKDVDVSADFLPDHIKKFQANQKKHKKQAANRLAKKRKAKANKQSTSVTQVQPILTVEKELSIKNPSLIKPEATPLIEKKEKVFKPIGGWSISDRRRNAQSEAKMQSIASEKTAKIGNEQIQFYPENPVTLTTGQYKTLQEILAEDTPKYTVNFEQVKDLLEEVGIKVERNGGSHAHIHTPGHNIKILVDIHYGWTSGYGPGTIKSLRQLMMNLGLNDDKFINSSREDHQHF